MHKTSPMSNTDTDLIWTSEAAEILHYAKPSSISRLVAAGKLTPARRGNGKRGAFLFHRSDVERLKKERQS